MSTEKFPLDALPPLLRETAEKVAYAYNSPIELVASSILTITGFCMGRGISMKTYHPDPIYGLLYMYLAASPGVGKSSIKPLLTPINSFVTEHRKRLRIHAESDLRNEWSDRKKEPTDKDIKERLGRGYGTLHTSIFTEEGLAQLLMNNDEYIVLHSTEAAGVVQAILGQGRQKMPLNNLLKHCYAGDFYSETYKSSEEAILIEPRMGVLLLSTPSTLNGFISNPMIQLDGTLSRFLVYSHEGTRQKLPEQSREIPTRVLEQWERITLYLLGRYWQKAKSSFQIKVTSEATCLHRGFYNRVVEESEERSVSVEETGVSTRVAENAGRIALILHVGLYQEKAEEIELSKATMSDGIRLAEFFFNQSLKILEPVIVQSPDKELIVEELFHYLKKANHPCSLRDLDKEGKLKKADRKLLKDYLYDGELVCWNDSNGNRPSLVISIANQPFIPDGVEFLKEVA